MSRVKRRPCGLCRHSPEGDAQELARGFPFRTLLATVPTRPALPMRARPQDRLRASRPRWRMASRRSPRAWSSAPPGPPSGPAAWRQRRVGSQQWRGACRRRSQRSRRVSCCAGCHDAVGVEECIRHACAPCSHCGCATRMSGFSRTCHRRSTRWPLVFSPTSVFPHERCVARPRAPSLLMLVVCASRSQLPTRSRAIPRRVLGFGRNARRHKLTHTHPRMHQTLQRLQPTSITCARPKISEQCPKHIPPRVPNTCSTFPVPRTGLPFHLPMCGMSATATRLVEQVPTLPPYTPRASHACTLMQCLTIGGGSFGPSTRAAWNHGPDAMTRLALCSVRHAQMRGVAACRLAAFAIAWQVLGDHLVCLCSQPAKQLAHCVLCQLWSRRASGLALLRQQCQGFPQRWRGAKAARFAPMLPGRVLWHEVLCERYWGARRWCVVTETTLVQALARHCCDSEARALCLMIPEASSVCLGEALPSPGAIALHPGRNKCAGAFGDMGFPSL